MKKEIIVEFKSGRAKAITVPIGYEIHIKDYDKEKYGDDSLEPDQDKVMCKYTIFGNAESKQGAEIVNLVVKKEKLKNLSKTKVTVRDVPKKGEVETYTI